MKFRDFFKVVGVALTAALLYTAKAYLITVGMVLFFVLMGLMCFGAIWHCLFKSWNPRDYFERRKERKLMEFTNNRDRG